MQNRNKEYAELLPLLGDVLPAFDELIGFINQHYEMEELWRTGKPSGAIYNELKFRRGGKTLIALYLREGYFISLIVLGKAEREKFEQRTDEFTPKFCELYEEAPTYHDGKWLNIEVRDNALVDDMSNLLLIKRRPNRKG